MFHPVSYMSIFVKFMGKCALLIEQKTALAASFIRCGWDKNFLDTNIIDIV